MLRSHLIEFLCEIEAHEQGSRAKACPLVDHDRPARTVDLDGLCTGPRTIGLTLKSV